MDSQISASKSTSNSVNHVRMFRLLWILLILFCTISLVPGIIYFWPANVWPLHPVCFLAVEGVPPQVEAGDTLRWTLHIKKYTTITPMITRYLVSKENPDKEIVLGTTTPGSSRFNDRKKEIEAVIPSGTTPGQYYVRNVASYDYFGFRRIEAEYNTPWVNVTENKQKQIVVTIHEFIEAGITTSKRNDKIFKARDKVYKAREKAYKEKGNK